jgi:hypothetical protein
MLVLPIAMIPDHNRRLGSVERMTSILAFLSLRSAVIVIVLLPMMVFAYLGKVGGG